MIGRAEELDHLKSLYRSEKFEFLVMYGRRRVGKTTLLQEFVKGANAIFYPAKEKNDVLNLEDFSKAIQIKLEGMYISSFQSWEMALDYIDNKVTERTAVIIDEFPFIVDENPSVKSILQHAIDHKWKKNTHLFLILCGSSVSFMENEVMGVRSPLHDRQTSCLEISPFDYLESSLFYPDFSNEQKLLAYGILGGIPRYLEAFDDGLSVEENIATRIVKRGSCLHEEPVNMLKAELRETNVYNSILTAIANGRNKVKEISDFTHEDSKKVSKYLLTLQTLRLVEKKAPCGENPEGRKGVYAISDNFFKFWFRYEFTNNSYYGLLGEMETAREIMADISNHMGGVFEEICMEYMVRLAKRKRLPFTPYSIGRWWGNNPAIKAQDDVDILLLDKKRERALFVECKYTSSPMPHSEYEDLKVATLAFPDLKERQLWFISKSGYDDSVVRSADEDGAVLLTIDDLFADGLM